MLRVVCGYSRIAKIHNSSLYNIVPSLNCALNESYAIHIDHPLNEDQMRGSTDSESDSDGHEMGEIR